jgi:hypothetical protein
MQNLLADAFKHLTGVREEFMAEPVAYIRRKRRLEDIPATAGRHEYNVEDGHGFARVELTDFIIRADRLASFVRPEPGDLIEAKDAAGVVCQYEVTPPANNVPCWEWTSPRRDEYRVHTQTLAPVGA